MESFFSIKNQSNLPEIALGGVQVLCHQRGGWVGQKKSKTWWRNTWMVPNGSDKSADFLSKHQNHEEDFKSNFFWYNDVAFRYDAKRFQNFMQMLGKMFCRHCFKKSRHSVQGFFLVPQKRVLNDAAQYVWCKYTDTGYIFSKWNFWE